MENTQTADFAADYNRIEESFTSASDALWFLNRDLERRAESGDPEAIRYLTEMNEWEQKR